MVFDPTPFLTRTRLLNEYRSEIALAVEQHFPGPYPVQLEVNPSAGCNQNCHWCISENMHGDGRGQLDFNNIGVRQFFHDFKQHGGRFIGWSGGGEPTKHKAFDEALAFVSNEVGLPQGLMTHGAFRKELRESIARYCDWVRVSIDTHNAERYRQRRGADAFTRVKENVKALVASDAVTVGLNMNVAEWNKSEINDLYDLACEWQVNYLQVRPTLPRHFSNRQGAADDDLNPKSIEQVLEALSILAAKRMQSDPALVVSLDKFAEMHMRTMRSDMDWGYKGCLAHELFVVLNYNGDLTVCMYHLDKDAFRFGNVYHQALQDIWLSQKRQEVVEFCENLDHGTLACQACCKGHEINKVLFSDCVLNIGSSTIPSRTGLRQYNDKIL